MKIINFGSLNIDHVYQVPHFVRPGETIAATHYQRYPGGKGLNQSIALGRAGAPVYHAGMYIAPIETCAKLRECQKGVTDER